RGDGLVHRLDGGPEPGDELGLPSGEVDVAAVEVIEAEGRPDVVDVLAVDGGAHEDAVQSGAPGDLGEVAAAVRLAVLGSASPPAHHSSDPVREAVEIVVVQTEASPDGCAPREVEALTGGQAAAGEQDDAVGEHEHRVRMRGRPVHDPHPEGV